MHIGADGAGITAFW